MDKVDCPKCRTPVHVNSAGIISSHKAWGEMCDMSELPYPNNVMIVDSHSDLLLAGYYRGTQTTDLDYDPQLYEVVRERREAGILTIYVSRRN